MKNMDSVFSTAMDNEVEFDVIFDQDDSLIDTVVGVDENGDPLTGVDFEDLHQDHDNATADDVKEGTKDDACGAKEVEGTKEMPVDDNSAKGEIGKDSDANDFYNDADKEYQEGEKEPKVDEDSVRTTIDKVIEGVQDIDDFMMDDEDDELIGEKCNKETDDEESDPNAPEAEENVASSESVDITIEDIEGEIDKEAKDKEIEFQREAAGVDSDVEKIDSADNDEDEDIIDLAINGSDSEVSSDNLDYEPSDEDLIDMVMNGN